MRGRVRERESEGRTERERDRRADKDRQTQTEKPTDIQQHSPVETNALDMKAQRNGTGEGQDKSEGACTRIHLAASSSTYLSTTSNKYSGFVYKCKRRQSEPT